MAHINLLPWREELRKQKKNEFITINVVAAAVMGVFMLAVHLYMQAVIDNQVERNKILKQEITLVEKKIEEIKSLERQKEQLISRMRVIEQLQGNRPAVVHMFDELARIVPDGLYINSLAQKGGNLNIVGEAQSNARVSAFMRELENSPWFKQPSLEIITSKGSQRSFTLSVKQDSPAGEEK